MACLLRRTSVCSSSSLTGSAFEPAGDIADEDSEVITADSGLQNSIQDEEWEDLADAKVSQTSKPNVKMLPSQPWYVVSICTLIDAAAVMAKHLPALQMMPNSSIHILAKSDENVPANSQTGVHNDWVDLKEKTAEDTTTAVKEKKSTVHADKVHHEVAALKMAQGLLKGICTF